MEYNNQRGYRTNLRFRDVTDTSIGKTEFLDGDLWIQDAQMYVQIDGVVYIIGGSASDAGTQGPQGSQGAEGPQGMSVVGPQGSQGSKGDQGDRGPQGYQGPMGFQGAQGSQGPMGNAGSAGTQGPQGNQGPMGNAGSAGVQGAQGSVGPQGTQGVQGARGTDGIIGIDGAQGPQGTQGVQGSTGSTGTQGFQGTQGVQGSTGANGTQGFQGTQGTQGTQGVQGSTGANGTQGTQGIQGVQGTSGGGGGTTLTLASAFALTGSDTDVTGMSFTMTAGKIYRVTVSVLITSGGGGPFGYATYTIPSDTVARGVYTSATDQISTSGTNLSLVSSGNTDFIVATKANNPSAGLLECYVSSATGGTFKMKGRQIYSSTSFSTDTFLRYEAIT